MTVRPPEEQTAGTFARPLQDVETGIDGLVGKAGKVLLGALAIFLLWASFVPMETAVVASGTVSSAGQNKVIQHRTGGVIKAIRARDGDVVQAGAVLFELDPLVDEAQLVRLRARTTMLEALKSRLEAEKTGLSDSSAFLTAELRPRHEATSDYERQIASEQEREFLKGRAQIAAELEGLRQKGIGLREQELGVLERFPPLEQQIRILETQFTSAQSLERRGHISKQQMWEIESRLLDRKAQLATLRSEKETVESSIKENDSLFGNASFRDERQTSERLTEVLGELQQISGELKAAESIRLQTELRAPVSGTVVRSTTLTIGGVMKPGDTVAEIVPLDAALEVDTRVQAKDIRNVRAGQPATVKISALNARSFDPIPGRVVYVAADSTLDERTGERFFKVRVAFTGAVQTIDQVPTVSPGMTGEVHLEGQARTFMSYLLQPIEDSLARAFGELG